MGLSHINNNNEPGMVDVGDKQPTNRIAKASAIIFLGKDIMSHLEGKNLKSKKGPVFQTAILAGVMGAKKTGDLIPLCHPIGMDNCQIDIRILDSERVEVICTASVYAKTGIEMEALTGASIAALTIYDMCKAMSHDIRIEETKLIEKRGGKRDFLRS